MIKYSTLTETLLNTQNEARGIRYIKGSDQEVYISYQQLYQRAIGIVHYFQRLGFEPGDEALILLKDDEQFIDAYWACILGGYVPVPLSVGISDEHKMRVFQVLQKLNRPFVYTEHVNFNRILNFARERGFYDVFKKFETHRLLTEQITDLSQPGEIQDAQPDDIAFIQFSSGSTRAPKGVSLTHGNLVANLDGIGKGTRLRPEDSLLSWMPLTHDMGLIGMHMSSLFQGIDQYLMPTDKFVRNPLLWMQKVAEHGVTVTSSPNFGYKHFLNAFRASKMEGVDLSTLRVIYNGAEPISLPLINKFQEILAPYGLSPRAMFPVYGLAEASLAVSVSELEAEPKAHFLHRNHLNTGDEVKEVAAEDQNAVAFLSVGKAVAHTEWGIYSEDGQALPEGHIGLIWIRGKNVTLGYYNDPEISREIQKEDGWLNTEDLGVSMDGHLVITGRAKEVIFLNGQNFYPQDLEKIIIEQGYSEIGKIAITAFRPENSSEDHILAFLIHKGKAEKFVDTMKAIRILINQELGLEIKDVIPVRQLPKTTSGKIRRIQLVNNFREGVYKELLEELDQLSREKVDTGLAISEIEQFLKDTCDTYMPEKNIGLGDNFFEIGTTSLALSQIHEKIDERFPDRLEITDYADYPSIQELAVFLSQPPEEA